MSKREDDGFGNACDGAHRQSTMSDRPPTADDRLKRALLGVLVALPMAMWVVFVVIAGLADHSSTDPAEVDETLRLVGVASGSALAVIAGSFLGIKNASGLTVRQAAARRWDFSINGWAALFYFVGLGLAVLIWALDADRAQADEVIQTALATLFGFGIGALKAATTPAP